MKTHLNRNAINRTIENVFPNDSMIFFIGSKQDIESITHYFTESQIDDIRKDYKSKMILGASYLESNKVLIYLKPIRLFKWHQLYQTIFHELYHILLYKDNVGNNHSNEHMVNSLANGLLLLNRDKLEYPYMEVAKGDNRKRQDNDRLVTII